MSQNKVVKKKKVDKELTLTVFKVDSFDRIFVEYSANDGRLVLQRNFQNTLDGKLQAQEFENRFKTVKEFKKYLRLG